MFPFWEGTTQKQPGDIFDKLPGQMQLIRSKLADHVGDHVVFSPERAVLVTSPGTKLAYLRPAQSLNPSSSELEEETQETLSEHEREQQHKEGEAEPASGSASSEGPALPALRKLTIDGNIPPILSSRTWSRRPHTGVEGEALHCFLPTIEAE